MATENSERRDSKALEPDLIKDPQARAEAEARNGLRQYDAGIKAIQTAFERPPFKLRLSLILGLHREALQGISVYAGNFRPGGVEIKGSKHEPVGAHLVPGLVEEMCDYVNDSWEKSTPIHLAAYVMWRLMDSSFRRWQRADLTRCLVRGPVNSRRLHPSRIAHYSRSNCR